MSSETGGLKSASTNTLTEECSNCRPRTIFTRCNKFHPPNSEVSPYMQFRSECGIHCKDNLKSIFDNSCSRNSLKDGSPTLLENAPDHCFGSNACCYGKHCDPYISQQFACHTSNMNDLIHPLQPHPILLVPYYCSPTGFGTCCRNEKKSVDCSVGTDPTSKTVMMHESTDTMDLTREQLNDKSILIKSVTTDANFEDQSQEDKHESTSQNQTNPETHQRTEKLNSASLQELDENTQIANTSTTKFSENIVDYSKIIRTESIDRNTEDLNISSCSSNRSIHNLSEIVEPKNTLCRYSNADKVSKEDNDQSIIKISLSGTITESQIEHMSSIKDSKKKQYEKEKRHRNKCKQNSDDATDNLNENALDSVRENSTSHEAAKQMFMSLVARDKSLLAKLDKGVTLDKLFETVTQKIGKCKSYSDAHSNSVSPTMSERIGSDVKGHVIRQNVVYTRSAKTEIALEEHSLTPENKSPSSTYTNNTDCTDQRHILKSNSFVTKETRSVSPRRLFKSRLRSK